MIKEGNLNHINDNLNNNNNNSNNTNLNDTSFSITFSKYSNLKPPEDNIEKLKQSFRKRPQKDLNDLRWYKAILCIFGILTLCFLNNYNCFYTSFVDCMWDHIHINVMGHLNRWLSHNLGFKNALIIIGSLSIDITMLFTSVYYCYLGESWRFLISMGLFYGVRALIQAIYIMTQPYDNLFTYPGFPSLFVSYAHTNDFFYSGHVGFPLLCGYEARRLKYWLWYISIGSSVYEGFVMWATRGHYSIDCYFGWIVCMYFIRISNWGCGFLDRWLYIGNKVKYPAELRQLNITQTDSSINLSKLNTEDLERTMLTEDKIIIMFEEKKKNLYEIEDVERVGLLESKKKR